MKLSQLFEKLEKSKAFKELKKESKDAFFCAGFFILNFKQNTSEYSLDFRDDKNIFTFKFPSQGDEKQEIIKIKAELLPAPKPLDEIDRKLISKLKVDIEQLQPIIEKSMDKNKVIAKLEESIAVLQTLEGKLIWNLTCVCAGFVILNIHINAISGEVTRFEKKNMMDFMTIKKPEKK